MPWADYRQEQLDALEETEEEASKAWALLLLLLLRRERRLRRQLRRRALALPVDDSGRWDTSDRRAFTRYRSFASRESGRAMRDILRETQGPSRGGVPFGPGDPLDKAGRARRGIMPNALDRVQRRAERRIGRARQIAARDVAEQLRIASNAAGFRERLTAVSRASGDPLLEIDGPSGAGGASGSASRLDALKKAQAAQEELRRLEREAREAAAQVQQPSTERERAQQDRQEIELDQADNPPRNAHYALSRVRETVNRATGRLGSPAQLDSYMGRGLSGRTRAARDAELQREIRDARRRAEERRRAQEDGDEPF